MYYSFGHKVMQRRYKNYVTEKGGGKPNGKWAVWAVWAVF